MLDMVQRRVTLRRASVPAGSPPEQAGTLARRTGRVTRQRAWLYQAGKGKGASVLPTGPPEQGLALRHKPQVPYQSRDFGVTGPQGHRATVSFRALRKPFCNHLKKRRGEKGDGKGDGVLPTGPPEQGLALRHKPQVPYQSRNFGVTGPQGHRANDSFAALRQPFCNQRKNRRNQGKQREPKSTALCFLCLLRFTTCKAGQRQECL